MRIWKIVYDGQNVTRAALSCSRCSRCVNVPLLGNIVTEQVSYFSRVFLANTAMFLARKNVRCTFTLVCVFWFTEFTEWPESETHWTWCSVLYYQKFEIALWWPFNVFATGLNLSIQRRLASNINTETFLPIFCQYLFLFSHAWWAFVVWSCIFRSFAEAFRVSHLFALQTCSRRVQFVFNDVPFLRRMSLFVPPMLTSYQHVEFDQMTLNMTLRKLPNRSTRYVWVIMNLLPFIQQH